MRKVTALMTFLLALLAPAVAIAQGFLPAEAPPWVFADNYGRWAIQQQAANSYTFYPNLICQVTQLNFGNRPTFFAFSAAVGYAPVYINDVNATNAEVVTPSTAPINTQEACGPVIAPVNNHTTFTLSSGSGGLQEALNAIGSNARVIYLTPAWYGLIAGIAGQNATLAASVSPASVLAAATCASGPIVVDITTAPETQYTCSGGKLAEIGAVAAFSNLRVSSYTNIAAPTALTTVAGTCATNGGGCITTATTGGTIPASAAYTLGATCVDAGGGETTLSVDTAGGATVTVGSTATNTISVTSPAGCTAANGAAGWRLYMTAASGASLSEILYSPTSSSYSGNPLQNTFVASTVMPIGATATISAIVTGTATVPAANTAYPRLSGASGSFPPFPALGTVAAGATGTLGLINVPAGALNVLGRQLTVCGNGYATTNSTGGTLTLATPLYSVPGVTSITPFTAVSGSTAASAQADPFDFCVTYTTAKVGASGQLEAHGWVLYSLSGTAVGTPAVDIITTVSSAIDLTKQDQIQFTIKPLVTALTAAQLRQLSIVPTS